MEIIKGQKTAILFDPHSLVGRYCLELLVEHSAYEWIWVLSERKKDKDHPKIKWIKMNYDKVDHWMDKIKGDDLFWCRSSFKDWSTITDGKSIRKALPFRLAWVALENKVSQLLFLSSSMVGREAWLPVLKQRAELENAVRELPFWAVHIFKPPLMIESTPVNRFGEGIAKQISELTGGFLEKFRPLEAEVVAKAMVDSAQQLKKGVFEYTAEELQALSEQFFPKSPRKT